MREILFRGKRVDNGEWIEGYIFQVFDDGFFITDGKCHSFKVIPETIGQYTGLTDKNGTKIFEGDIVKHPIGTLIVKFLNGTFFCSLMEDNYLSFLCSMHNQSEIIGNIHDNPELIKGAKQ